MRQFLLAFCAALVLCYIAAARSYRKWRTERKVTMMVGLTWLVPMAVFFTSIFGWQHFVGYRSVPAGRCYVQYMEDALFNCLLQVRERR